MASGAEKTELLLSINNFDIPASLKGIHAVAKLLYNLIMMKPGVIASSPDMGVHIIKYRFEEIDDMLITRMQSEIYEQTSKYLPDVHIDEIVIEHFDKNSIRLGFSIRANESSAIFIMQANNNDTSLNKILKILPRDN